MKKVAFVILHYGDAAVTHRCVRSVLRMDRREQAQIVIVDNDVQKAPERRADLRSRYDGVTGVTVLTIQKNGGFSYANNMGYAYAREKLRASVIVVLNNDIVFCQKDFLDRLDRALAGRKCCVLGPDIVKRGTGEHQNPMDNRIRTRREADRTVRLNRAALFLYPVLYPLFIWQNRRAEKVRLRERRKNAASYASIQKGRVLFGACLIFCPAFVEAEEKAFEPETGFYYEEYILACRCAKKGYETIYDPSLSVVHESGSATGRSLGSEKKRLRFVMENTLRSCEVYREYIEE